MVVGERFERERVRVSGARFERCRFVECELVFDGRPVHLAESHLERCSWHFEGPAAATLQLVATLCGDDAAFGAMIARRLGLEREAARQVVAPRPAQHIRRTAGTARRR